MHIAADSFILGVANSLHCAGMCGPLASCMLGGVAATTTYHFGRMASYVLVGMLLGAVGASVGTDAAWLQNGVLSLAMAGVLLICALGAHVHLGSLPFAGGLIRRMSGLAFSLPPIARGAVIGSLTPLLPCGLLYIIYARALVAGSWAGGGIAMLGFALGSLPALVLAQAQVGLLRRRLSPDGRLWLMRGLLLVASSVLLWRGYLDWTAASCCH